MKPDFKNINFKTAQPSGKITYGKYHVSSDDETLFSNSVSKIKISFPSIPFQ